jgi:hypothetical protein
MTTQDAPETASPAQPPYGIQDMTPSGPNNSCMPHGARNASRGVV